MTRVAYFVDVAHWSHDGFLREMLTRHPLVFSIAAGATPKAMRLWEEENVRLTDFRQALKDQIIDLSEEDMHDLLHLNDQTPGLGKLEVLFKKDITAPHFGDIVLWRPVTREPGDDWSTAGTVAHLQSYGFRVLDEHGVEVTHASIAPNEDFQIRGKDDVWYYPDSVRTESHYVHDYVPVFLPAPRPAPPPPDTSFLGARFVTTKKDYRPQGIPRREPSSKTPPLTKKYRGGIYG